MSCVWAGAKFAALKPAVNSIDTNVLCQALLL